jgi:hypothetical protein
MSNRPVKKNKKVVEITQEDFDVEWTPPPRSGRDRFIQFGVLFLIICFLLPAITCAVTPDAPPLDPAQQAAQQDPVEQQIRQYSKQLSENPNDPTALANLGYYTTLKAARLGLTGGQEEEKMTLLVTSEKYLRDALKQDPDYSFATAELAKNLMMQEKTDEANTMIEEALVKIEPKLASEDEKEQNDAKAQKIELLRLSAVADVRAGKNDTALEKMGQVIELKPGDPRLYMARAELHATSGDKEAARADLTTAIDIAGKIGDVQSVGQGRTMLEALDNPPKLEIVDMKETVLTPSPTP